MSCTAGTILTSLLSGDPENGVRLEKDVRGVHRAFWTDLMHLVTRVRDTSELEILGATLLASRRRCTRHVSTTGLPVGIFVHTVMDFVVRLLVLCASFGRASIWKRKFSTRGHWPTGVDDLLPHGPDHSTRGLLFWLLRDDNLSFGNLFFGLLMLVPTQVAPEILRQRPAIRSTLFTRFMTNVSRLQHSDSPSRNQLASSLEMITKIFLIVDHFPPNNVLERIPYHEKMTYAVVGNFYHFDDSYFRTMLLHSLVDSFQSLILVTPGGQAAWDKLVHAFPPEFPLRGRPKNPYIVFRRSILGSFGRSQCDATGCNRYGEVEGIKLRKCAQCRIAFYCSRECQTAHWRADIHPHKAVCTVVQKVHKAADDGLPDDQFSAACVAAGISADELAYATHLWRRMSAKDVPDTLDEEVEQRQIRCASRIPSHALLTNF